jgi:hypothetical protein
VHVSCPRVKLSVLFEIYSSQWSNSSAWLGRETCGNRSSAAPACLLQRADLFDSAGRVEGDTACRDGGESG